MAAATPRGGNRYTISLSDGAFDFHLEARGPGETEYKTFMRGTYARQ